MSRRLKRGDTERAMIERLGRAATPETVELASKIRKLVEAYLFPPADAGADRPDAGILDMMRLVNASMAVLDNLGSVLAGGIYMKRVADPNQPIDAETRAVILADAGLHAGWVRNALLAELPAMVDDIHATPADDEPAPGRVH